MFRQFSRDRGCPVRGNTHGYPLDLLEWGVGGKPSPEMLLKMFELATSIFKFTYLVHLNLRKTQCNGLIQFLF